MDITLFKRPNQTASANDRTPDFDNLFQEQWKPLCRVVYSIVGDIDEAQDLVLEAFIKLYHRPPANNQNLSGWLYRVAINLGLNALRTRKRRQHYEELAARFALENPTSPNPESELERTQEQLRVRAVLGKINPRSAQVLILRHSGFSYAEIAAALGVASSSVGVLLARAEREFEKKYSKN